MTEQQPVQPRDPWTKVNAAIRELREGHRLGRTLQEPIPHTETGERWIESFAEEHGRTADACRKLRQFASLYGDEDLKELIGLCRQYQRAFGLTLVYKLVCIEDRKTRRAVQEKAIAGHWGHAQLSRELRARLGHRDDARGRKQRGRKPQIPTDTVEILGQIAEMTFRLVRWQEHFAEMDRQGRAGKIPTSVAQKLRTAVEASRDLYESASRACKRSQKT